MHSPQLDVIAQLRHRAARLARHVTPSRPKAATRDGPHAEAGAARFLDALLAHGTTAAVVFPTVHKVAADALFAAAEPRGMRLIAGKVLMDRHAPDGLRDDVEQAERDCRDLIDRWHGRGRLAYAVTVRFAPTSTPAQLAMAGRAVRRRPDALHADPRRREPRRGALGRRAVSRGAQLPRRLRARRPAASSAACSRTASGSTTPTAPRCARAGAQIAHSPSSNLFLGSGLFDWRAAEQAGVEVSLASDVGGGTSLSMLRTMADAYKVQAMAGQRLTAWTALHAATRGAAQALQLGDEIGSLEPGCHADVCVWDWAVGRSPNIAMQAARDLHERVFAWMTWATSATWSRPGRRRHALPARPERTQQPWQRVTKETPCFGSN